MPCHLGQQARAAFSAPVLDMLSPVLGPTPGLLGGAFDLAIPGLIASLAQVCDARLVSQRLQRLLGEASPAIDEAQALAAIGPGDPAGRVQSATLQGQVMIETLLGERGVALAQRLSRASDITPMPALRVLSLSALVLLSMLKREWLQRGADIDALEALVSEQARLLREQPGADPVLSDSPLPEAARHAPSLPGWMLPALGLGALVVVLALFVQGRLAGMSGASQVEAPGETSTLMSVPGMVRVYFRETQWEPPDDAARLLANVVAYARQYEASQVVLQGYEVINPDPVRTRLSRSRLMAVRGVLISAGIVEDRIRMAVPLALAEQGDAEAARRVDVSIQR